tara:strand:- start:235 stop:432 length:198 start_codon:yes stop_codon:yes gene_type:complete
MSTFQQILLISVAVTGWAWAWVSTEEYNDEIQNETHYCSMVSTFEETEGEHGWPNFKNINCEELK